MQLEPDSQPDFIDCAALVKTGDWQLSRCCEACHQGRCFSELDMDLGNCAGVGGLRLNVCCSAALGVPYRTLQTLVTQARECPAPQAPAAPTPPRR